MAYNLSRTDCFYPQLQGASIKPYNERITLAYIGRIIWRYQINKRTAKHDSERRQNKMRWLCQAGVIDRKRFNAAAEKNRRNVLGYPIRKFEKKDTEQVMRIWLDGNIETHGFVPEAYWMSHFPLVQEQLLQADLYVYEQSGTIQGFVGMTGDFLAGIFVDKKYRSAGIGKSLLEHIKKIYPAFSLNVYQKNQRAVNFYQREGLLISAEGIDEDTAEAEYTMRWNGSAKENGRGADDCFL